MRYLFRIALRGRGIHAHALPRENSPIPISHTLQQAGEAATTPTKEVGDTREYALNCLITKHSKLGRIEEARAVFEGMESKNPASWNCMISAYARQGMLAEARSLFDSMPRRNRVTWNTMISGYCRANKMEEARQLFDVMHSRDEFTWAAMISGYARCGLLDLAKDMLLHMPLASSVSVNVSAVNALISGYARHRRMHEAEALFRDPLIAHGHRDMVSWNAMVSGFARNEMIDDAHRWFLAMPQKDESAFSGMLSAYLHCGRIDDAFALFKNMPNRSIVSWTIMISGLAKNRRIMEARQIFEEMPQKNVITWNALIAGYVENKMIDEASRLFERMPEHDAFSYSAMINGYVQVGRLKEARELLESTENSDVVSWTAMVTGYIRHGKLEDARQIFEKMPCRDVISWNALLSGYVQHGNIQEASHLFNSMTERDLCSWNTMISGYAQCGMMEEACHLFHRMPKRNTVSWNTMINGFVQNQLGEEALRLYCDMLKHGEKPDTYTCASVISVSATLRVLAHIHANIVKRGIDVSVAVGNVLIKMYSNCGRIDLSRKIFDGMRVHDQISWNSMIVEYGHHGHGKEALELFESMTQSNQAPNQITFVGVLSACNHSGFVDKGWLLFQSMAHKFGIEPEIEHYACMLDLLCRAGSLLEAASFIEKMPFKPSAAMLSGFLSACRTYGNMELAEPAAEQLFRLEPNNTSHFVMLSNIYAACGKWDEVEKLRAVVARYV